MSFFSHNMVGRLVFDVDAGGCMASDHKLKRVGEVIAVKNQREIFGSQAQNITVAVCRTLQSRDDLPKEIFYVSVDDTCLQKIKGRSDYWYIK